MRRRDILDEFRRAAESAPATEPGPSYARADSSRTHDRAIFVLLASGLLTAAAACVVAGLTPCDPTAAVASIGGGRMMPQPWGNIVFGLNVASPILLGLATSVAMRRPAGIAVGFLTWLVSGFVVFVASATVWQLVCPE